jgi:hypothetical protein
VGPTEDVGLGLVNSVAFAERSKVARHEAVHAAASIFLGSIPDEVRINPLADDESGYITGFCEGPPVKRSVAAVWLACGVVDGHGVGVGDGEGDLYELEQLVPDVDARARVLDIARRVMEHREFRSLRDAIRRRLQFRDVLYRDELERIAVSTTPEAFDVAGVRGTHG